MADLVCQRATQIHPGGGTAGKRSEKDDDAVVLGVVMVVNRECGVAEKLGRGFIVETNSVDVENCRTANTELLLHRCLFGGI